MIFLINWCGAVLLLLSVMFFCIGEFGLTLFREENKFFFLDHDKKVEVDFAPVPLPSNFEDNLDVRNIQPTRENSGSIDIIAPYSLINSSVLEFLEDYLHIPDNNLEMTTQVYSFQTSKAMLDASVVVGKEDSRPISQEKETRFDATTRYIIDQLGLKGETMIQAVINAIAEDIKDYEKLKNADFFK